MTPQAGRSPAMDVTRAVACAMVVLVHTAATYFYAFGPMWLPSVTYDAVARAAVPIFFMLSGALLLWKDEPIPTFYRRRASRVVPPLVFWTVVYVVVFGDRSVSWTAHVAHYLMEPYRHLWYFYVALGLYLSAPFLSRMLRASTPAETRVFLMLWFLVSCVLNQVRLLVSEDWDPPSFLGVQLFSGFVGYFVLGAYLTRYASVVSPADRWRCLLVFVASVGGIVVATCLYSGYRGEPNEFFFAYQTPLVAMSSVSAFVWLTTITRVPTPLMTPIRWIADGSLGIYGLHPMILWLYVEHLRVDNDLTTRWARIPIVWLAVLVSTALVIHLARKIPLLRRVA